VVIIPNPDVRPESGWSAEAGIKQGVAIGEITGQADFSVFMSQNKDMIEYYLATYPGLGTGFKATNIEQSRIYGGELELILNRTFGRVNSSLNAGYTFINPVQLEPVSGEYLKYRRKHSGKLSLNTSWKKLGSEISLYARSKILRIDSFFLNETTGEVILPGFPGYWEDHNKGHFLMDWTVSYKLSKIFSFSVAVKNLTNAEYMGRPGDIQPQRNYSIRFSARF
jgi:iron complex outermembrane receptor protein